MNWYYVEAGQQAGPVPETELDDLARSGRIKADTLVWHEGMANWKSFAEARPESGLRATDPALASPLPPGSLAGDQVVCAQCNGVFSKENAIRYGSVWVCASCKPIFVQKLKEGAVLPGMTAAMNYAGFWIRFGAYVIDQIILTLAGAAIGLVVGLVTPGTTPEAMIIRQVISILVGLVIGMAYVVFFLGKFGATPGKMACHLRVVTPEGMPITYGRAFGRYFASILSGLICSIGYIMAAFDEEKRALHDRICNTRVVRN